MLNPNSSLIDILKPYIKKKENKTVIEMLNIAKDEPEAYLELLSVAILHRNLDIAKLIIDKFISSDIQAPNMNAYSFFNSIWPDNSKYKLNDPKENYFEIVCPFVLMAGIGGDIKIFQTLWQRHLIPEINASGEIGLSKRFNNIFTSNIIGACSYYGNDKLLEYLLKNYRSKLDINFVSKERKSKRTRFPFSRELGGATPALLACQGVSSDEDTIKILKILEEYDANLNARDSNEDNIIHIAVKTKKIKTLKMLINSFNLKDLINESNINNMTPFSIANKNENREIISFLNSIGQTNEKEVEKNIKELIEDSNKRASKNKNKKKGKKSKKNDFPFLLNSSEYQESIKVNDNNDDEEINRDDDDEKLKKNKKANDEEEEDEKSEENENKKSDDDKHYTKKEKRNNKKYYSNYKNYKNEYNKTQNNIYINNYNNNYNNNFNNYNDINNNNSYKNNYNNNIGIYNNNTTTYNTFNNITYRKIDNNNRNNYDNNKYFTRTISGGYRYKTNLRGYYNFKAINNSNHYLRNTFEDDDVLMKFLIEVSSTNGIYAGLTNLEKIKMCFCLRKMLYEYSEKIDYSSIGYEQKLSVIFAMSKDYSLLEDIPFESQNFVSMFLNVNYNF